MTLAVGFHCTDGVVIASDSMITHFSGGRGTGHQVGQKVFTLSPTRIFAFAGDPGQAQRMRYFASACELAADAPELAYGLYVSRETLANFEETKILQTFELAAIAAFRHRGENHCCVFMHPLQPQLLDTNSFYAALGSGKPYADPFLAFLVDIFCDGRQPSVREAVFMAAWCLDHTIRTNTGGVKGPIQMAVMEGAAAARFLTSDEIDDQLEAVVAAQRALKLWRGQIGGAAPAADPAALPAAEPPAAVPAAVAPNPIAPGAAAAQQQA